MQHDFAIAVVIEMDTQALVQKSADLGWLERASDADAASRVGAAERAGQAAPRGPRRDLRSATTTRAAAAPPGGAGAGRHAPGPARRPAYRACRGRAPPPAGAHLPPHDAPRAALWKLLWTREWTGRGRNAGGSLLGAGGRVPRAADASLRGRDAGARASGLPVFLPLHAVASGAKVARRHRAAVAGTPRAALVHPAAGGASSAPDAARRTPSRHAAPGSGGGGGRAGAGHAERPRRGRRGLRRLDVRPLGRVLRPRGAGLAPRRRRRRRGRRRRAHGARRGHGVARGARRRRDGGRAPAPAQGLAHARRPAPAAPRRRAWTALLPQRPGRRDLRQGPRVARPPRAARRGGARGSGCTRASSSGARGGASRARASSPSSSARSAAA